MNEGYQWLQAVANRMNEELKRGAAASPESLTVKDLLWKFGFQRRGDWINNHIRNGLEKFKLRTDQDFAVVWLDSQIKIELDSDAPDAPRARNPTHTIGALPAAHRKLVQPSNPRPRSGQPRPRCI